jgi:hypothetical protein
MKLLAAAAAVGVASLLATSGGGHVAAAAPPAGLAAVGPLDLYFRADAVGRTMQALAITTCGTERWPVKTVTDYDRLRVHLHPDDVSIKSLRGQPGPTTKPQANRAGPVERHTYRVHARLVDYVREDDGDYHLVLRDKQGRTIVAEIPSPSCVGSISPVKRASRIARQRMDGHYAVTTAFKTADRRVVVKGVGFFDFQHGQTGMAPNGLELHPVTGLRFPG